MVSIEVMEQYLLLVIAIMIMMIGIPKKGMMQKH